MTNFPELLAQGTAHAWFFFPSALLLGALHGLEPGHSKTLMAAFIVAIRGTVKQAAMLGLAATISHTAVVWIVAVGGMYLTKDLNAQTTEPYFQLVSALVVIAVATWMLWTTWSGERKWRMTRGTSHSRPQANGLAHDHAARAHDEGEGHDHKALDGLPSDGELYQDAHETAHANDIKNRFAGRDVTNGQIIMFGLTGGLIPCPAAITVLLLCLQLKHIALGAVLVFCFSVGLAITLVVVGAAAAIGATKAIGRWPWLSTAARRAPYLSSALMLLVGLYIAFEACVGLIG